MDENVYNESHLEEARVQARQSEAALWRSEIERVSEILNEAADSANLCADYEAAIERVNQACSRVQLIGRSRTYNVYLTTRFEIEARSEQEADDLAMRLASEAPTSFRDSHNGITYEGYTTADTSATELA